MGGLFRRCCGENDLIALRADGRSARRPIFEKFVLIFMPGGRLDRRSIDRPFEPRLSATGECSRSPADFVTDFYQRVESKVNRETQ